LISIYSARFINNFFSKGHSRTLRAKKNITVAFIVKGLGILISFLVVPLTLGYVGKIEYGIWMIISSIIQWFAFFDVGLGNGLRTKLAEAVAKNEIHTARAYISSVYLLISCIAITMFVGFYVVARFISWNKILNTEILPNNDLLSIVVIVFMFFCIGFVLKLISSILQALQMYAINDILALSAQLLGLVAIYALVKTTQGSLFYLCLVFGAKSAVIFFISSIYLFFGPLKMYRPQYKYINLSKALPLLRLGARFFLNQILYLIVTQTSIFLVAQYFGPETVTVFILSTKYMYMPSIAFIMILSPFLSAFTEAYTKKDINWIRNTIKQIKRIWIFVSIGTVILAFLSRVFFRFWVGDAITLTNSLIIALAISNIANMWNSVFGLFLNGIGKLKVQSILLTIQAALFFPVSYLFYKLNFGVVSIVLTQIIFYISGSIILTLQYERVINATADGVWAD